MRSDTALPSSRSGGLDGLLLDIGGDVGALIVTTDPTLEDREIEVSTSARPRVHAVVHEHRSSIFAAVFVELPAGVYSVLRPDGGTWAEVTIAGGDVQELDVRTAVS